MPKQEWLVEAFQMSEARISVVVSNVSHISHISHIQLSIWGSLTTWRSLFFVSSIPPSPPSAVIILIILQKDLSPITTSLWSFGSGL